MKKIMKIAGIIIAFLVTTVLVISIISVNVKYHRYFDITELDGKDKYTTEWGNVSIDGARIFSKKEMIGEYPDIESYIKSEDDSKGYVMVYVSFDVTDVEKYDAEWFKLWTIEADKIWSNGRDMIVNSFMNSNNKITENKEYQMYCVFGFTPQNIQLEKYDDVHNLDFRIMINHNPIIYYKLGRIK